jgi:putative ABC transport system permease protein
VTALRVLLSRLAGLFGRGRRDRQLSEEVQAHLDLLADEYATAGMSRKNAEAAARRAFGGVEQIKADYRDQRGWPVVDQLLQDVHQARRILVARPGGAALAVATLALGVGVSLAFFSIVNAHCLRGLPIPEADRVVFLAVRDGRAAQRDLAYHEFEEVRRATRTLDDVAAFSSASIALGDEVRPADRFGAAHVSENAFRLLRLRPVLGRDFSDADHLPGAPAVVLLSRRLWASRYASDEAVIGSAVRVNGVPAHIAGVMPDGFPSQAEIWMPLQRPLDGSPASDGIRVSTFGRLAGTAGHDDASAELRAIGVDLARRAGLPEAVEHRVVATPVNDLLTGNATDTVWIAFLLAGMFVFLVACANVANVILMRSAARAREMALRTSMGATRARIVRQVLVESAVLTALGGGIGLALSVAGVRALAATVPASAPLPYWTAYVVDGSVVAVLITLCFVSVFIVGLIPARHAAKANAADLLKDGGREIAGSGRARWWPAVFLTVQFSLTMVLLAGTAGDLVRRDDTELHEMDLRPAELLTGSLAFSGSSYPGSEPRQAFLERLLGELEAAGEVTSVAVASHLPLSGAMTRQLMLPARPPGPGEERPTVRAVVVSPGYFRTLGIPLSSGRDFTQADGATGSEHAVVNQRFADAFFPDGDTLGQRIGLGTPGGSPQEPSWVTIVGVSPDVRQAPARVADPVVYLPMRGAPPAVPVLIARVTSASAIETAAARVRDAVGGLDRDVPVYRVMSLDQAIYEAAWNGRVSSLISRTISGVAFSLALVGLYAITAYGVALRRREIGVRIALGARPFHVAWLVLRQAARRLLWGMTGGVACLYLFRDIFGSAGGPLLIVPLFALVLVVSLAATLAPAIRATRVDPLTVLRAE